MHFHKKITRFTFNHTEVGQLRVPDQKELTNNTHEQ